jgi:hypothetical protein
VYRRSWPLRACALVGSLTLALVGCERSGAGTTPDRDGHPVAVAAAAPQLHGPVVMSGTYRLSTPGPQTVTLPLKKVLPTGDAVVAATATRPGGPWGYAPATVAPSRRAVTFTAFGPSLVIALSLAIAPMVQDFETFFAGDADGGRTPVGAPSCADQQAARSGYQVQVSGSASISWCLGMRGGNRVLTMVNGLTYPLEIAHPGMPVTEAASPDSFRLTELSRALPGSESILEPGQEIGYSVTAPASSLSRAGTEFDGLDEGLHMLQSGMSSLLDILIGFEAGGNGMLPAVMNAAARLPGCVHALLARNPVALMSGCFGPDDVVSIFQGAGLGTTGWLLAPAVAASGVAAFLDGEFQHIHNFLTRQEDYSILVGRTVACPDAAQVLTAWNTAPPTVRDSWAAPEAELFSFQHISCWNGWVAAEPVGNGNGWFVFSQVDGLHLVPASDMPEFTKDVCSSTKSPSSWKSDWTGPTNCSS